MSEDTANPSTDTTPEDLAVNQLKSQAADGEIFVDEFTPEDIARTLAELTTERAEFEDKWKRALAECANIERRAAVRSTESRKQAIKGVVSSFIGIIDHFDLALAQDTSKVNAEQLADGVRMIRDAFLNVLTSHGVQSISPATGDEFQPGMHEAVTQLPNSEIEPGAVANTFQSGYKMDEWVIRPAKVAIVKEDDSHTADAPEDA